ncbi:MAG: hypothetical protein LUC93_18235 [Planctomycetaceae bacterium]|nr:hypothetical protein [Planctomycetaceae bacterium]
MQSVKIPRTAALIAALVIVSAAAWSGERRQTKPYGTSANDTAGLLDQINRDHGAPKAKHTPRVRRPSGGYEYNPYDPRKFRRDSPGMIDAINRDYPPVYPRRRP